MPKYTNHGRFELALALMAAVMAAVVILRRIGQPPLVAYLFLARCWALGYALSR
jgi:Kef-type K+ transport system membrane component KefB